MKCKTLSTLLKRLFAVLLLMGIFSYSFAQNCTPQGDELTYGNNNVWIGYVYQETNLTNYKGFINKGGVSGVFDESFVAQNGTMNTNGCSISTKQFSTRLLLKKSFAGGTFSITAGASGGYRLSLDGGTTWAINHWTNQPYNTTHYSVYLKGNYNFVLEYFITGNENRVSFSISTGLLPLSLKNWSASLQSAGQVRLSWVADAVIEFDHFILQRSINGKYFFAIQSIQNKNNTNNISYAYEYLDKEVPEGVVYYRLVMVDKDGTLRNSVIQTISSKSTAAFTVFPTIIQNNQVGIKTTTAITNGKVELITLNGQPVQSEKWPEGSFSITVKLNTVITHGTYFIKITDDKKVFEIKKIIIQ